MKRSITFFCAFLVSIIFSASSYAQSSGLLLGVNVFPVNTGLQVASTISNTPAVGKLYPGDILRFITAYGHPVYSAQYLDHLEKAKSAIGANQDAFLLILRNGMPMCFKIPFLRTQSVYRADRNNLSMTPVSQSEARRLFGNDVFSGR
ncbi:MAG: hypothetical protein D3914_14795 [Candidatus Electrothrix sp. LOE2]|jgi:hypothetical protein|nr:hypothetical protein [Candidatus Electrothrix sp. LOE2]